MEKLLVPLPEGFGSLGVGRTKGYELIAAGEIELVKIGSKSLLTVASIHRFVAKLMAERDHAVELQDSSPGASESGEAVYLSGKAGRKSPTGQRSRPPSKTLRPQATGAPRDE